MSPRKISPSRRAITTVWLILLASWLPASVRAETKIGDLFPALATAGLDGALPATAGKIVLVDFWASWCAPCKASFPLYAQLYHDYASQGVVVIAVSVDQDPAAYEAFVRKFSPPFAVVRDRTQQLVREVSVPAMPTCFLLGRDGRVRYLHRGFHGAETDREIRKELNLLLEEKSSAP